MTPAKIIPSGVHALFAVDPGGTTGIAAGYVDLKPMVKDTLRGIERRKAIEISGDWLQQARTLAGLMEGFVFTANVESRLPLANIHIVFEDFVLRLPASTANLISVWVAAGAVALFDRDDIDVTWQQPSEAKSFATDDRLRLWGLWERGSAHKRDAWRHVARRVNDLCL